jgi:phosphoglycerate kinase
MSAFKTLDDLGDVTGKAALVRVDLNLPMQDGHVTDETRIRASAPTILELAEKGAKVLLLAHFGRPKGERSSTMSLSMVIGAVEKVLGKEVMFVPEVAGDVVAQAAAILRPGDIAILENTRFWKGEEKNDPEFVKAIAANGDFYVNDAFSAAHRAHATTGAGPRAARLCRPVDAGRTGSAEQGARHTGKAGRGRGRRRQSVLQAGRAQAPCRAGRSPHHRRRHGEHFPRRKGC